jgi:hypothetical protein
MAVQPVDPGVARALQRLKDGGRPPALPDFREGAAQGLITAAAQASAERGNEFAAVYLRLAQNLHDDDDPNVGKLRGYTATPCGRKEQSEGTNDV